jgi:type VI secretion system ImpA family protein
MTLTPLDLDALLSPITGPNPSGENLRYTTIYDAIKEARREEPELPQGVWALEWKQANWPLVIKLITEALITRTKDLQLATWLTEALLRREGITGLRAGLDLIKALIGRFWSTLYPPIDEGDLEWRAATLEWLATRMDEPIKRIPLTHNGLDWFRYNESRVVPSRSEASGSKDRQHQRAMAIKEGKLTPEEFNQAFEETPKTFYIKLVGDFDAALDSVDALAAACREKFGELAPSFDHLGSVLLEIRGLIDLLLQKKPDIEVPPALEACYDPVGSFPASAPIAPARAKAPSVRVPWPFVSDRIHFTLTAPRIVAPGTTIELVVWVHLATQRGLVLERARDELALRTNMLARTKGPVRIAAGSMLTIRLSVPGVLIEDPEDVVLWEEEIGCAGFIATVPKDCQDAYFPGVAVVYCSGIQIAKLHFVLTVGTPPVDSFIEVKEMKHKKAFASYANSDRDEVLARLQGIQKAVPNLEISLDVLSLRSGENWEAALWTIIPANDVFYLFWSTNASRSKWVEKEWRCALHERGLSFIDPVPLQPPHVAPPPPELASLHFYDWMLAFMRRRWQATDSPTR